MKGYLEWDGRKIHFVPHNYHVAFDDPEGLPHININGRVKEVSTMAYHGEDACKKPDENQSLSKRYRSTDLTSSRRRLLKNGLLNEDGTLTEKGKDFLLNILFDDDTEKLMDDALIHIENMEEND